MFAAAIEVRHDCPVGSLSRSLPNLRIVHWCVDSRDLFHEHIYGPATEVVPPYVERVLTRGWQ